MKIFLQQTHDEEWSKRDFQRLSQLNSAQAQWFLGNATGTDVPNWCNVRTIISLQDLNERWVEMIIETELIDDLVDEWHQSDKDIALHTTLGMTYQQYNSWVEGMEVAEELGLRPLCKEPFDINKYLQN